MIRAEQIPDEVVDAAGKLLWYDGSGYIVLPYHMRAAIAAAINAWPHEVSVRSVKSMFPECIVLPLPNKEGDA